LTFEKNLQILGLDLDPDPHSSKSLDLDPHPMARNEIRRNFVSVRATHDWNSLPNSLKEIKESKNFKRALKLHMVDGGRS
jgi:hypothetical protein